MANPRWSRDELLLAFRLYQKLPFGQIRHGQPDVIALARLIDRTPNAVAMKMGNLASFDPQLQARQVSGLSHASKKDGEIFEEFARDPESLANECESAFDRLRSAAGGEVEQKPPDGPTEVERTVRARRVQRFFRDAVMANYDHRCALTGIAVPQLVNASHIIPWKDSVPRRADPTNGVLLCTLYDTAFDRGLITFDNDWRLVLSRRLQDQPANDDYRQLILRVEGRPIRMPDRASPDPDAMAFHRREIFERCA